MPPLPKYAYLRHNLNLDNRTVQSNLDALSGRELNIGHSHARNRSSENASKQALAAFQDAFDNDLPTQRAVCYLLLPDYLCVNALLPAHKRYRIPLPCHRQMVELGWHTDEMAPHTNWTSEWTHTT